jgi:hypothetical protein
MMKVIKEMDMKKQLVLSLGLAVILLVMASALLTPVEAQRPARTPRPTTERPDVQATVNAVATQTSGDVQLTVEAVLTEAPSSDAILATTEAIATHAAFSPDDVMATAQAIISQSGNVSPELQAMLESWTGSVSYNETTGAVTLTTSVSESTLNLAVDEAMNTDEVFIDLVPGGAILWINAFELNERSGTLVVETVISAESGEVLVEPVSVTFNGNSIPLAAFDSQLQAATTQAVTQVYAEIAYSVDELVVFDTYLIVTVTVQ